MPPLQAGATGQFSESGGGGGGAYRSPGIRTTPTMAPAVAGSQGQVGRDDEFEFPAEEPAAGEAPPMGAWRAPELVVEPAGA